MRFNVVADEPLPFATAVVVVVVAVEAVAAAAAAEEVLLLLLLLLIRGLEGSLLSLRFFSHDDRRGESSSDDEPLGAEIEVTTEPPVAIAATGDMMAETPRDDEPDVEAPGLGEVDAAAAAAAAAAAVDGATDAGVEVARRRS